MSSADNREIWGRFWEARRPGDGTSCPAGALQEIHAAQRHLWQAFARSLSKGARVLDLGTGNGVVLANMAAVRPDLKLIGVDSSPTLPAAAKGISLRAGVAMERLPFPDGRFDVVTSQFGFEYGETAAASLEVARVLKAGGAVRFIVHHRSGPILAHNAPRREALHWALAESGYLRQARALAAARASAAIPTPVAFQEAPREARRLFPGEAVAAEFLAAVLETLERSRGHPPGEALEVLKALEDKAENEIGRIDSLAGAACDGEGIELLAGRLRAAGLDVEASTELFEPQAARPLAWLVRGRKLTVRNKGS